MMFDLIEYRIMTKRISIITESHLLFGSVQDVHYLFCCYGSLKHVLIIIASSFLQKHVFFESS